MNSFSFITHFEIQYKSGRFATGLFSAHPHLAGVAREPGPDQGDSEAGQDHHHRAASHVALAGLRRVDQGRSGAEGLDSGRLREEEQVSFAGFR